MDCLVECTSVGSVKGINQRLVTTARSCNQVVGPKRQVEKMVVKPSES